MSTAVATPLSELETRGDEFGRELAVALVLAGERADRDHATMRAMTAVAAREMRAAVDYLRAAELPQHLVHDYERACRNGFQAELHGAMEAWRKDTATERGQQAA